MCLLVMLTGTIQDINIQNMNIELVAQMFKNYQSNVLFHLEGMSLLTTAQCVSVYDMC
jgi:DASH complex subunit DAD4